MQHRTFGEAPTGSAQHFTYGSAPPSALPSRAPPGTEAHISPLAVFSEQAVMEHRVAQQQLRAVEDALLRKRAALAEREAAEKAAHEDTMAAVAEEEQYLLQRLADADTQAERTTRAQVEWAASCARDETDMDEELAVLNKEVEELLGLEDKLSKMRDDITARIESVAVKRTDFARDLDRGMSQLEAVRHQTIATAGETRRFNTDDAAIAAVRGNSPTRRPRSSAGTMNATAAVSAVTRATPAPSDVSGYGPQLVGAAARSPTGSRFTSPSRQPHHLERRIEADVHAEASQAAGIPSGIDLSGVQRLPSAMKRSPRPGSALSNANANTSRFVDDVRRRSVQFSPREATTSPRRASAPAAISASTSRPSTTPMGMAGGNDGYYTDAGTNNHNSMSVVGGGGGVSGAGSSSGSGRSLHTMCSAGQVDAALESLRCRPELASDVDGQGNTPLHCACAASTLSLELVNALISSGASVTALNDDGLSPFHLAALNTADNVGHGLKKFLVFKAGVNPNQRTSRGETVAHLCAAHDRHVESLRWLTSAGVDVSIVALTGSRQDQVSSPMRVTALDKATHNGIVSQRSREVLAAAAAAPPGN